jgi:hypothetical protein
MVGATSLHAQPQEQRGGSPFAQDASLLASRGKPENRYDRIRGF